MVEHAEGRVEALWPAVEDVIVGGRNDVDAGVVQGRRQARAVIKGREPAGRARIEHRAVEVGIGQVGGLQERAQRVEQPIVAVGLGGSLNIFVGKRIARRGEGKLNIAHCAGTAIVERRQRSVEAVEALRQRSSVGRDEQRQAPHKCPS